MTKLYELQLFLGHDARGFVGKMFMIHKFKKLNKKSIIP